MKIQNTVLECIKKKLFSLEKTNALYRVNGKQTVLCYCHGMHLNDERETTPALHNNG